jgi:succinyl-diaminopimelate desuccinylase
MSDGSDLGIAVRHEVMGSLTINLGTVKCEDGVIEFGLDIRFPMGADADTIKSRIEATLPEYVSLKTIGRKSPIYSEPDSPLVKTLSWAYEDVTGEPAHNLCMGGTTYAKALPNCVAFGPCFPSDPETAHQVDEYWSVESIMKAVKVFTRAIVGLAGR